MNKSAYNQTSLNGVASQDCGWTWEQWISIIPPFISNVLCSYTGTPVALEIGTISSTPISGFLMVPGHVVEVREWVFGQDQKNWRCPNVATRGAKLFFRS
jgi:hypothetical protein